MPDTPEVLTNDTAELAPYVCFEPPLLSFEFPGLQIGVAEYREGPTGCTVFYFPEGARCAIDTRGGAVGATGNYGSPDAICFAGGSLYGLEAATGVAAELFAMRGYSRDWNKIAAVNGAILWDLSRDNSIYPDKALGRAALWSARTGMFPLGARGAGRSAGCGGVFKGVQSESTGQGAAFRQVGRTKVAVFTVVNAVGAIVDRQGQVVRGYLDAETQRRVAFADLLERQLARDGAAEPPPGNTTLTLVVTNQAVNRLDQIAKQVHASMARAIQPFHTEVDGDVLYAVTTGGVEEKALGDITLGALASELAWDAVLSSFQAPEWSPEGDAP
jgi:6-aminohexanoate-oligomer endohydrolase